MRKLIFALGLFAFAGTGCAGLAYSSRGMPPVGLYVADSVAAQVTENDVGSRTGEACSQSILGLLVTGDASAKAAAENGGITKIGTVNYKYSNILGIIASFCTVVTGE